MLNCEYFLKQKLETQGLFDLFIAHDLSLDRRKSGWFLPKEEKKIF